MTVPDLVHTPYRFERMRREWPSNPLIDWKQVEDRFLSLSPEDPDQRRLNERE